jgi:hypothetical protein
MTRKGSSLLADELVLLAFELERLQSLQEIVVRPSDDELRDLVEGCDVLVIPTTPDAVLK